MASTSKVVGDAFFTEMARFLAQSFGIRWVFVSSLDPQDSSRALTVSVWDGEPRDNLSYELKGSPCENILSQGSCQFPSDIQAKFPQDRLLVDMGAHSYVGTPLRNSSGDVIGLIAVLDDKPIADCVEIGAAIDLLAGRAGAELDRLLTVSANERLGRIVEASVSEAFVFSGENFRFELVNRGARTNLGYTLQELKVLTPWDLKPEYTEEQFRDFVIPLQRGEVPELSFETVHQRKDGTHYDVEVCLQFFKAPDNAFFASINDITARKQAEEREKLLVREVNHRAKNLLSLVQVIARQTASRDPKHFVKTLEQRISALAATQNILVDRFWRKIPMDDLVRSHLAHFEDLLGSRIKLAGDAVAVSAEAAQVLGMALHELATNAAKYGALSEEGGTVHIGWSATGEDGDAKFVLEWRESDGPAVHEPAETGFGTIVLDRQPRSALQADVTLDYAKTGLCYRLEAPAERVLDK
ncbi:HWE histidine kinase domain-containing protein [Erythrobacter alti]|uniref:HWE histidine kinase domain-containing protein n=1 Tax=Erythrobacter alti TaxID=1896145 RepID=UPI0030F3F8F6